MNLGRYLKKGDVLILNDSKVIPARLLGKRYKEGRPIEIFLLKEMTENSWQCLIGGKRRQLVDKVEFLNSKLLARILKDLGDGTWEVKFNLKGDDFWAEIEKIGFVPIPPYIKKEIRTKKAGSDYYQTVYAKEKGSVAAPTAGFHFTQKLINKLKKQGIDIGFVTLHVGLGTFMPIKKKRVESHKMHKEWFELDNNLIKLLDKARKQKRRIIAVGTTTVRALESANITPLLSQKKFILHSEKGETDLFIKPGYKFKYIDGLITNFHLPCSTLLLLAAAFFSERGGLEKIKGIYQEAIKKKYRFYSFGDAMFIQ